MLGIQSPNPRIHQSINATFSHEIFLTMQGLFQSAIASSTDSQASQAIFRGRKLIIYQFDEVSRCNSRLMLTEYELSGLVRGLEVLMAVG